MRGFALRLYQTNKFLRDDHRSKDYRKGKTELFRTPFVDTEEETGRDRGA
jgi:hypothetical protein